MTTTAIHERNPGYWDKARPYLDRVVMRPLPDSQARFASLEAGEMGLPRFRGEVTVWVQAT
jgi:ABC-type transport system substrate-binding protein